MTNEESPFYGEEGVEPGTGSSLSSAAAPCTDNPDYLKACPRGRTNPRLFRAIKVSF